MSGRTIAAATLVTDGDAIGRYPNRLAQALGGELDRRGWSNRKAGTEIGLNHVTISAMVLGTTPNPSWETIHKIALFLAIDDDTARAWWRSPAGDEQATEDPPAALTSGRLAPALRTAVIPEWMKDPDLVVLFYGLSSDLTQEELDSIKPIVWREYLRVKARRGERVEASDRTGDGAPP